MRISLLLNCDTRPEKDVVGDMFDGVRSWDFLTDGLQNKIQFFDGFDLETIVWVDEHVPVPHDVLDQMRSMADRVVLSKHSRKYRDVTSFSPFNDINYIQTFALARGEVIAHFDQDTAAFRSSKAEVDKLLSYLDRYKFVSYPSSASPKCVDDSSFGDHVWASTRFFLCRKETINLTELEEAVWEPETLYAKYHKPVRVCNWVEHFLGVSSKNSVLYPPLSKELLIFPWQSYSKGTLKTFNSMPFSEASEKLIRAGAHTYHGVSA